MLIIFVYIYVYNICITVLHRVATSPIPDICRNFPAPHKAIDFKAFSCFFHATLIFPASDASASRGGLDSYVK